MKNTLLSIFLVVLIIIISIIIYIKIFNPTRKLDIMDISTITNISKIIAKERNNKDFLNCIANKDSRFFKLIKHELSLNNLKSLSKFDLQKLDTIVNACQSGN
ncbi:hypothetical protein ACFX5K_05575 [Rickettsiales bacterium LUAb2]